MTSSHFTLNPKYNAFKIGFLFTKLLNHDFSKWAFGYKEPLILQKV